MLDVQQLVLYSHHLNMIYPSSSEKKQDLDYKEEHK
jgi:hypothetical protein